MGNFSATIRMAPGWGQFSFLITGPRPIRHFFDIGGVLVRPVRNQNVVDLEEIYIFAYSILA